jgi:hypothetical protein
MGTVMKDGEDNYEAYCDGKGDMTTMGMRMGMRRLRIMIMVMAKMTL